MVDTIKKYHDDLTPHPMFIGMFDVLGFKNIVKAEKDLTNLISHYQKLLHLKMEAATIPVISPDRLRLEQIGNTVFSDTILFWCDNDSESLDSFLIASAYLIAVAMDSSWPLRGGIAYGNAVMSKRERIFVGQPVIDAYEMELCQQWIGAAFHPTCFDHSIFSKIVMKHDAIINYPVPTGKKKDRIKSEYAVHWGPYSSRGGFNLSKMLKELEEDSCSPHITGKFKSALRYLRRKCMGTHAWHSIEDLLAQT